MLKRLGVIVAIVLGSLVAAPSVAKAVDTPISCPPGSEPNPRTGVCVIVVTTPGGGVGTGAGGGVTVPVGLPTCTWNLAPPQRQVPCSGADGWWVQSQQCYAKAASPQPPPSDPAWQGHTSGAVYDCVRDFPGIGGVWSVTFLIWLATPPAGAPPDPRVLAQRAVAVMNLTAIDVGIVPEPRPGSVGLVGMPNWMWVDNPSQNTWGPITRTATAGGWTVKATAKVSQVDWDMGDGQVISCGSGSPYRDSYGRASSPTCGHIYTRQGAYTVRATSHWVITWAGIGQTGTIPMDLTQTANVTIGEAQVLRQ